MQNGRAAILRECSKDLSRLDSLAFTTAVMVLKFMASKQHTTALIRLPGRAPNIMHPSNPLRVKGSLPFTLTNFPLPPEVGLKIQLLLNNLLLLLFTIEGINDRRFYCYYQARRERRKGYTSGYY